MHAAIRINSYEQLTRGIPHIAIVIDMTHKPTGRITERPVLIDPSDQSAALILNRLGFEQNREQQQ